MIKLPEPLLTVDEKLSSIIPAGTRLHTEQSLKQAVRDALNLAADTCESTLYVEGDGAVSVFGPKTDANVEIRKCRDAIRALIKEIPE